MGQNLGHLRGFVQPNAATASGALEQPPFGDLNSIENHLENIPYKVMFASGDWTCTISTWKGKMIGPWKGLDGKVHPPTNKTFELEFYTVARWKDRQIVE